jgi:ribosomal protein S18 acetylase RimI-like enzyme
VTALERALAFLRRVEERASSRVETLWFGTAYLRPELPNVWSRNFVWMDIQAREEQTKPLLAEVDRVHEGIGVKHRRLVFDAGSAGIPAPSTWRVQDTHVMVYRDGADAPAPAESVREVDPPELRSASEAMARANPDVTGEGTVEQLLTAYEFVGAATQERCFAAMLDGTVASYCRLYSDGQTAQIEDVGTLPAYRKRGLSRAVVTTALAAATRTHELTFLLADEDDWPRHWYERLGFERAGMMREVLKT